MAETQKRFRILFVDDVPANIKILTETLKTLYDVVYSDNGREALRLAAEDPQPDLILLDIMMPEMNGYEVCEKLKEDERTRNIPVMFITALTDEDEEERGLELGAVDYIRKPFNLAIVKARIKTQLDLKQHRDHLEKRTVELLELNEQLKQEIAQRKETEEMIQEHLAVLQSLVKEHAFPSSGGRVDKENP